MILQAGVHTFHEAYVAFHFARDNAFCPWVTIGCGLTYGNFADAKYIPKYNHLRDEFRSEAEEAGGLSGTYDFMNNWHIENQSSNAVVSKVIRYRTMWGDMWGILQSLVRNYVGVTDTNKFAMLAIMLKSRKGYFPVVYQDSNSQRANIVASLKEAGLIK
tara:strand:+ start:4386 stop:4865 length:480 start_codon:yes stop_codon:yes gene_type:complete